MLRSRRVFQSVPLRSFGGRLHAAGSRQAAGMPEKTPVATPSCRSSAMGPENGSRRQCTAASSRRRPPPKGCHCNVRSECALRTRSIDCDAARGPSPRIATESTGACRSAVRGADGVAVGRRHRHRHWLSPLHGSARSSQVHLARLGGGPPGRDHRRRSRRPGVASARARYHPLHRRRRADADVRAADPSLGRPDRDALPRLRVARVPRLLPRLEGVRARDRGGRGRPLPARALLAAVGLRSVDAPDPGAG